MKHAYVMMRDFFVFHTNYFQDPKVPVPTSWSLTRLPPPSSSPSLEPHIPNGLQEKLPPLSGGFILHLWPLGEWHQQLLLFPNRGHDPARGPARQHRVSQENRGPSRRAHSPQELEKKAFLHSSLSNLTQNSQLFSK